MVGPVKKAVVQLTAAVGVSCFSLEVDEGLPQHLRAVQHWLVNTKGKNGTRPLRLAKLCLELSKRDPDVHVVGAKLQVLCVQQSDALHLPQASFQVNVLLEQLRLGADSQRSAQEAAGLANVALADLKVSGHHPHLGKRELLVGHQLEARRVHLASPSHVRSPQLLEHRVAEPEVDVTPPVALLLHGRDCRNGPLVYLPDARDVAPGLFHACPVEPGVVVQRVLFHRLGVLLAPPLQHGRLDAFAAAVLLLELHEPRLHVARESRWQSRHGKLENGASALHLPAPGLELGKGGEESVIALVSVQLVQRALVHAASESELVVALLPLGVAEIAVLGGPRREEPLVDGASSVRLARAHLELDVGDPGLVLGLPAHPPLEHSAGVVQVPHRLFEPRVLVPELVVAREERHDPVKHVAGAVDELVSQLHGHVPVPHASVLVVHVKAPLQHGARSVELLLLLFELGVRQVQLHVVAVRPNAVL
mmetsp:Transcript_12152/g.47089  ORF Transcript_12152/g.47089 Transcript_12152/m.47089 type:complete len:478 (+) Transcript_12152:651-2084(+)